MSFTKALENERRSRTRPCKLGRIRDLLSSDDREALDAALADGRELARVHRALRRLGHDMAYTTVTRHAHGDCGCDG